MKKKRILALPGFFLPHNDTITQMSYRILCNLDCEIDVLCFLPNKDDYFDKFIKKDPKFKKFNFYYLNYTWKDLEITPKNYNIFKINKIIKKYALEAQKLSQEKKYDYIFSFSVPNYTHLAAYNIKKKLGNNIEWFASFSDPIKNNIYIEQFKKEEFKRKVMYVLLRLVHYRKKYENVVLKYSDRMLFISEALKKYVTNGKKEYIDKSIVYPITYVGEWINNKVSEVNKRENSKKVIFAHFGNIYALRKIYKFIDALNELAGEKKKLLSNLEIHQYGDVDRKQMSYIKEKCNFFYVHDRVNYDECINIMKNVDVLLIFDTIVKNNEIQPFLPSKIIDYLLMNKPIFAVTTQNSPLYDIIKNDHICVSYDVNEIKHGLIEQLLNYNNVVENDIKQFDNNFVSKKVLGKYFDIIDLNEKRRYK